MKKIFLLAISLSIFVTPLVAQSFYPGQRQDLLKVLDKGTVKVKAFDLDDVRLLPSRFKQNQLLDSTWLTMIPIESLVRNFYITAGLDTDWMNSMVLGGWESPDIDLRGHTTGHILSAYALLYASTGEKIYKDKGDSLVIHLKKCQDAIGSGYLSAYPETLIDRNLRGESVWAPWYTLHKILAGLLDQYLYCGNSVALQIAEDMGEWAYNKLDTLNKNARAAMLKNEFGGVNETFYNLYSLTGNSHFLWLGEFFYSEDVINPLKKRESSFGNRHANTFLPKVIGEARLYEIEGGDESRAAADFFWHEAVSRHVFVTGIISDHEHFFDPAEMHKHLSPYTGETCCTYNLLKLTRHVYQWSGSEEMMEYYERALINDIYGQQDPETCMIHYFQALEPGAYKFYSTKYDSFWCCVGSSFESHAKYSESIYFHDDNGIYVNLFIPSTLRWKERGISLSMTSGYPEDGHVNIKIGSTNSGHQATIYLRYPSWSGKAELRVNGHKMKFSQKPGSYIPITRKWQDGDLIEVNYPMFLHVETIPSDKTKTAFMYGPVVLAGALGTEGMSESSIFSNPKVHNDYYSKDYHVPPYMDFNLRINTKHPEKSLVPTRKPLEYKTKKGTIVMPLYDIHRQRYIVYWNNHK